MCPKDADGMAKSLDPDQTAPLDLSVRKPHYGMHYKERVMNHRVIVCESTGKVINIIEILGLSMSNLLGLSMSNLKFSASTADWFVSLPLRKTSFLQTYLNIRS